MMPILAFISSILGPLTGILQNLHTSDADKLNFQNQLVTIQNQLAEKMLDYESKLMQAQADVIKAEAMGNSLIQRIWRPTTMLVLLVLVVCDSFGWLKNPLSHDAWLLIQMGMAGYIGTRSLEKIVPGVVSAIKDSKSE